MSRTGARRSPRGAPGQGRRGRVRPDLGAPRADRSTSPAVAGRHRAGGDRGRRRRGHRRGLDAARRHRARARDDEPLPLRARQGRADRPDERRDPRRAARRRGGAAPGLARRRCARSRSPREATSSATRGSSARCSPRPRAVPGPNSLRHFDQSVAAVADTRRRPRDARWRSSRSIDDYVFGFSLRAYLAGLEQREEEAEPGWMQAVFDYMAVRARDRRLPQHRRASSSRTARRAAGTRTSPAMALDEGRFERGLERLLDGVAVELERQAPRRRRGR